MDYQTIFQEYLDAFQQADIKIASIKIKIAIFLWEKYLFIVLKNEKIDLEESIRILKKSQKKILKLENTTALKEFILHRCNRFLYYHEMKYNSVLSYLTLLDSLKIVIKNYKENDKTSLFVLQILLHLFVATFDAETNDFNQQEEIAIKQFKNWELPEIQFTSNVSDLKDFVTRTLCCYPQFDFSSYYYRLLKKEH